MKILHIVPTYLPAVRYGGPIYSVHGLASALVANGADVHVYTTNVDGPSVSGVPLGVPVNVGGVSVSYFPTGKGRRIYRSPQMSRVLNSSITNFDIVHLHSVFLWPTSIAAHAARRFAVPYVLSPRGMLVRGLIDRKSAFVKKAWIALFERRTIENAAAMHFTSQIEANEFQSLGLQCRRSVVIANGVDLPPEDFVGKSFPYRQPFILFLGRLNWKKGLDLLIPAMARVPEAELIIAGNDEENYRVKLEDLARRSSVANRVRFIGPVHGPEKWQLLRSASLFVLPSYSENFGIAVLEAMAVGCPVIVSSEVGLANTVRSSGAGLVVNCDTSELVSSITQLLSSPDDRARMGSAGQKVALADYSWQAIARQMRKVYQECIDERGSGVRPNYSDHSLV